MKVDYKFIIMAQTSMEELNHLLLEAKKNKRGVKFEEFFILAKNACAAMTKLVVQIHGHVVSDNLYDELSKASIGQYDFIPESCIAFLIMVNGSAVDLSYTNEIYSEGIESYCLAFDDYVIWVRNQYLCNFPYDFPYDMNKMLDRLDPITPKVKKAMEKEKNEKLRQNQILQHLEASTARFSQKLSEETTAQNTRLFNTGQEQSLEKQFSQLLKPLQTLVYGLVRKEKSDVEVETIYESFAEVCSQIALACISLGIDQNTTSEKKLYEEIVSDLRSLLGESAWCKMDIDSQKHLVTARFLYQKITDDLYDYSGVCISAIKALENELRKRFVTMYFRYLRKEYATKFSDYPTSLLRKGYPRDERSFSLGDIDYILCLKIKYGVEPSQFDHDKNVLLRFVSSVLMPSKSSKVIWNALREFGSLSSELRERFRNPAAHIGELSSVP